MEKPKNETKPEIPEPQIQFKNDSDRLKDEYDTLFTTNRHLHDILLDAQQFCWDNFGKNITITMIYRTDEEQDNLYKNDPKYRAKPFKSPHQYWQAFDLRSSTFTPEEIVRLVNYLNDTYNMTNYYKWTAKCHDIGAGEHFHVQFLKKG